MMKKLAKIFAGAVLVAGLNSAFADGRKEATMDAGKGAFKLTVSVPGEANGPYDFSKNTGPVVNDLKGKFLIGEVMFDAPLSDTAGYIFQARIDRSYVVDTEEQRITAENLAQIIINKKGFKGREVKIPCPPTRVEGAEMVCYKMSGTPIFKGDAINHKSFNILASVSFGDGKMGYTLLGSIVENDVNKFEKDPKVYEKHANGAIIDLYKNHKVVLR